MRALYALHQRLATRITNVVHRPGVRVDHNVELFATVSSEAGSGDRPPVYVVVLGTGYGDEEYPVIIWTI
jgi:hypothetical protein